MPLTALARPLAALTDAASQALNVRRVFGEPITAGDTTIIPVATVVGTHGLTGNDGVAAGGRLLALPEPPDAVFCVTDWLALGVIRAAEDRGLRVPDDLSVTGFDGVPLPWWPGELTTVVQPAREKGVTAGCLVRALLEGEHPADVVLPTELRIGSSAGPLAQPSPAVSS